MAVKLTWKIFSVAPCRHWVGKDREYTHTHTHTAERFKMSQSSTEGVTESGQRGFFPHYLLLSSHECAVRMCSEPCTEDLGSKLNLKKKPEPCCIFQLPASAPPSQSLFYKSVSSPHSRTDRATPNTLIACYSPHKIITCSSPWLCSTFHF